MRSVSGRAVALCIGTMACLELALGPFAQSSTCEASQRSKSGRAIGGA